LLFCFGVNIIISSLQYVDHFFKKLPQLFFLRRGERLIGIIGTFKHTLVVSFYFAVFYDIKIGCVKVRVPAAVIFKISAEALYEEIVIIYVCVVHPAGIPARIEIAGVSTGFGKGVVEIRDHKIAIRTVFIARKEYERLSVAHQLIDLSDSSIGKAAFTAVIGHACISAEINSVTPGERGFGNGSFILASACRKYR